MGVVASYLQQAEDGALRDPVDWNPEFSRRARGLTVYAALRQLGRSGVAELVDRLCAWLGALRRAARAACRGRGARAGR